MKHLLLSLVLALGFTVVAPTSDADAWKRRGGGDSGADSGADSGWGDSGSGKEGVPELSPTLAGSALVLLLGGVAYIASRRREDA